MKFLHTMLRVRMLCAVSNDLQPGEISSRIMSFSRRFQSLNMQEEQVHGNDDY